MEIKGGEGNEHYIKKRFASLSTATTSRKGKSVSSELACRQFDLRHLYLPLANKL